jgi:hypothetical protein
VANAAARAQSTGIPASPAAAPASSPQRGTESSRPGGAPVLRLSSLSTAPAANVPAGVRRALSVSRGDPLTIPVRGALEQSLGIDLSPVRVHTGAAGSSAADNAGARAFALGSNVFLGRRERPDDLRLMAHEVAHVVQQQSSPTIQRFGSRGCDNGLEVEADRVSAAVAGGQRATVVGRTAPQPQFSIGSWLKDKASAALDFVGDIVGMALDFIKARVNSIPGYSMLAFVIGRDPVTQQPVARDAVNLIRAVMGLWPGGDLIFQALQKYGIIDKVGGWLEGQISGLAEIAGSIKQGLDSFLKSLKVSDVTDLGGVWERAKRIFTDPIVRIGQFIGGLVSSVLGFIRDAILMPIANLAESTPAYGLLKSVIGKDPITGAPAPQDPEALIGGFMKLIGQDEIWQNMQKAKAVPRAFGWFKNALSGVKAFVQEIPTLFINAFKSLEIMDLVVLPRAFSKVAAVFGGFFSRFFSWAGTTIWNLLEIIFDVVSPGALAYIKKTGAALKSILKNPLPFVKNLVKAAMLGFQNFAGNILTHLKAGLIDWLTGSLPGVYIPQAFTLGELVKFVFSVLGLSWQNVRVKLVKAVGEPAVKAMETGFDIVITLVTKGPAAAWEKIKDQLSNLKDMVVGGITDFVIGMIVTKAVPKIISMFIPGAGFISAIISIYDTIMVFVNKISKIIQVVTGFIDSIVSIASGAIDSAAKRVESTLAGLLSLAINFLAGFVGLGKVADKLMGVINKVRAVIDKGLDALINWVVTMAKKLFARAFSKDKKDDRSPEQKKADLTKAMREADLLQRRPGVTDADIRAGLPDIKNRYRMTFLNLVVEKKEGAQERVHIEGHINPPDQTSSTNVATGPDPQCSIKISRPSFRSSLKERFAARYPGSHKGTRLAADIDRRHIVSSDEIAKHLEGKLNALKLSQARDLLTKKGVAGLPDPASNADIQAAASQRHRDFFNDLDNLWPGDASDNRSIGAARDPAPGMDQAAADAHAKAIYAKYCLD